MSVRAYDVISAGSVAGFAPMYEQPYRWQEDAACRDADPDLFFPERGQSLAPALAYCAVCPVRQECLNAAIKNRERVGIWGGLSGRQLIEARKGVTYVCVCDWCSTIFPATSRVQNCCGSLACRRARNNESQRKAKAVRRMRRA